MTVTTHGKNKLKKEKLNQNLLITFLLIVPEM